MLLGTTITPVVSSGAWGARAKFLGRHGNGAEPEAIALCYGLAALCSIGLFAWFGFFVAMDAADKLMNIWVNYSDLTRPHPKW